MRVLAKLNLAQRIVVVVALGIAVRFLGDWLTALGIHTPYGWVAYAPLSGTTYSIRPGGLTFGWVNLIWIGLTVLWGGESLVVLRSPRSE